MLPRRMGVHGVGDDRYPIAVDLIKSLQSHRQLVNRCDRAWREYAGRLVETGSLPRQQTARCKCSAGFCYESQTTGVPASALDLSVGLLKNVLRRMRATARKQRKELKGDMRHPLLLVDLPTGVVGWLISRSQFNPLTCHAWAVRISGSKINNHAESQVQLKMDTRADKQLPSLQSFEEVVATIAEPLAEQHTRRQLQYQLPGYCVRWNSDMTTLFVTPFDWVSMTSSEVAPDTDDESDKKKQVDEEEDLSAAAQFLGRLRGTTLQFQ